AARLGRAAVGILGTAGPAEACPHSGHVARARCAQASACARGSVRGCMKRAKYALFVLFAINAMNFFDRVIGGAVAEPIRKEWHLSDSALGALGTAFTLLYAFAGVPLGRLSDRFSRKKLLAGGVFFWSLLTGLSGITRNFWQLFATRLGVGVGEAVCAPAGTSLIGDLYPPERRGRAMSLFMMGLPIGIALSFFLGGSIAHAYGWRAAFFVA